MRQSRTALLPLFLVSAAAVGIEIALIRYFAVAKWSEYGYWVISIVMVGFALSGVLLALFRDAFVRRAELLLSALPALLILAAALGFQLTVANQFNPLQLQNQATWRPQLWNIAGYYASLLPFFLLAGTYLGVSFVLNAARIGRAYGYDLTGAGCGAALALGLMLLLHPFALVPALLVPLAMAALFTPPRRRLASAATAFAALAVAEALLLLGPQPAFNDFKAIYAPLNVQDAQVVATVKSPRGYYMLLDDFTERVDTDLSNNAGLLGVPGPPQTFGLYRDGNRLTALPKPGPLDARYGPAALDALPYALIPGARVLLAGASGGFRIAQILALGARHVDALEPEPVLRRALDHGLGPSPPFASDDGRVRILGTSPLATVRGGGTWDVIDISADFLDASEANAQAFATEAIAADLAALTPGGIISIPVSIRDFPVYAMRMLATVRAALLASGVRDPAASVVVYRSAWSVRILLSNAPWSDERIAEVRRFAAERSFDVSYYPGIDVAAARAGIYNDLPAVSFASGEVSSTGPDDAIANEARLVLDGRPTQSAAEFNLRPVTFDRPGFHAVLNLSVLGTILKRLEILPQAEIGALVNLAVLAQAIVIAVFVLLVPLLAPGRVRAERGGILRPIFYFAALGLGFLFIEIVMIDKASFYLSDRTSGFALVLTGMLIFSGLGSMMAGRFNADPRRGIALSAAAIAIWCSLVLLALEPLLLATLSLPWIARATLVLVLVTPASFALGVPFPLGLSQAGESGFLPWAWALNGAFSVIATPLANLIAREAGYSRVLLSAILLYGVAFVSFPLTSKRYSWRLPTRSRAVD